MAQKNLAIRISLLMQKRGISRLRGSLNLLGSTMRAVFRTAIVAGFFLAIRKILTSIQAITTKTRELIKTFTDLNFAAMKTAAILTKGGVGDVGKVFDIVREKAREMAMQVMFTAKEIQDGFYTAAIAGYDLAESIRVSEVAMKLSQAGAMEYQAAINGFIGVSRAFNIETGKMAETADIITAAFSHAKQTLSDYFTAIKYVAPIATAVFGDSTTTFMDTSAALMTLSDQGLEACYDKETEVLTKAGWKYWADATKEDIFATVNPKTKELEYQSPKEMIKYKYKGKMYCASNRYVDYCVTPNHRMFVRPAGNRQDGDFGIVQAKDLAGKSYDYMVGGLKWKGVEKKYFYLPAVKKTNNHDTHTTEKEIKILMDVWVEFLGYYLSEGSCNARRSGYETTVCQSKRVPKMENCLDRLGFHYGFTKGRGYYISNKQLFKYVEQFGKAPDKFIPQEIKDLPPKYLEIFYNAFSLGDGDERGRLYTSAIKMKGDLEEIILKIGWGTLCHVNNYAGQVSIYKGKEIISRYTNWMITANKKHLQPSFYKWMHKQSMAKHGKCVSSECQIGYDDYVYCAEVPNGLLIVRHGNKTMISGNSKSGVYLRGSMNKLNGATNRAITAFAKYGVNIYQNTAASQKYFSTLTAGQKALGGYEEKLNKLKQQQFSLALSGETNSKAFTKVSASIDKVKQKMSVLEKGTSNVFTQFKLAGGKLKPFSEVLDTLSKNIPTEVVGRMFGIRGGQAIMALLNKLSRFKEHRKTLEEYWKASKKGESILEEIFSKMLQTVLVKGKQITNSITAIFDVLFGEGLKAARPILDIIIDGFEKLYEKVKKNLPVIEKFFKELSKKIEPIIEDLFSELLGAETVTDFFDVLVEKLQGLKSIFKGILEATGLGEIISKGIALGLEANLAMFTTIGVRIGEGMVNIIKEKLFGIGEKPDIIHPELREDIEAIHEKATDVFKRDPQYKESTREPRYVQGLVRSMPELLGKGVDAAKGAGSKAQIVTIATLLGTIAGALVGHPLAGGAAAYGLAKVATRERKEQTIPDFYKHISSTGSLAASMNTALDSFMGKSKELNSGIVNTLDKVTANQETTAAGIQQISSKQSTLERNLASIKKVVGDNKGKPIPGAR